MEVSISNIDYREISQDYTFDRLFDNLQKLADSESWCCGSSEVLKIDGDILYSIHSSEDIRSAALSIAGTEFFVRGSCKFSITLQFCIKEDSHVDVIFQMRQSSNELSSDYISARLKVMSFKAEYSKIRDLLAEVSKEKTFKDTYHRLIESTVGLALYS